MARPLLSVLLFFAVACFPTAATAQNAEVDLSALFEGIDLRPSESAFIAPPREVIRPLIRCKKLLAKNEISEAVEILGELLSDDAAEDYLISRGSSSFTSLRRRTETILGSIDDSFLEPYRVRYNIRARKLLEKGVAESDPALLKQVSNRFFFTESGSEAAMLLGHMDLSRGQPSSAQAWFSKIVRFSSTAKRHDPEASILLATCQLLGSDRPRAAATLLSLKQRLPKSSIEFQGKNFPLFNRDKDALPWLTSLIGDSPLAANASLSEWLMVQGNPARTGKTGVGLPLLAPRWELPIGESLAIQNETTDYLEELVEEGQSPTPATQPLVVKDTVIYRDAERLYGVDFKTGRRQWAWPPQMSWQRKPKTDLDSNQRGRLYQRLASDSIFGRASSDGQLVFFVPSPGRSFDNRYSGGTADPNTSAPEDIRKFNELVALDVGRSGSLAWRIGGPTGLDEPKLAKTYFIGEPLPLEGVLYCCCVRENAVQLVAIDSKTGKLRWSQAIASYSGESFNNNHFRRLAGVTPSYADGKLVCLTGTGGVVALELATRSLIWGYEFQLPGDAKVIGKSYANALTDVWRDSVVTIDSGKVFLTPVLSRNLICLNLDDGEWAWFDEDGFLEKRVPRNSSLYLAGVADSQLILVGAKDVRALDAISGEEKWLLTLAKSDVLTGRGYLGNGRLFVPSASQKILQVDLKTGRIVESVATSRILGNLARVEGDVLSLGFDHIASFPELGLNEKAFEKIELEELSEQQQFVRAQMLIQKQDSKAGLDLLITLAKENPAEQYLSILKSLVSYFEDADLALSIKALDAIKEIYPDVDVSKYERSRALTRLRMGDFQRSATVVLDEIEKKLAESEGDNKFEISTRTAKRIAGKLIDREHEFEDQELSGEIKPVANKDLGEVIRYSEFGWRQAKLLMAMEGLEKSGDKKALTEITSRATEMISVQMNKSEKTFAWLLAQLHQQAIDRDTLLKISQYFLTKKQHLAALQYANLAIRRSPDNSQDAQLLKADILLSGKDVAAALALIKELDADSLSEANRELRQRIEKDAAEMAQSIDEPWRLSQDTPYVALPANTRIVAGETAKLPEKKRSAPIRVSLDAPARMKDLRMEWTWFGENSSGKELEIRDASGSVVRRLQIDENSERLAIDDSSRGRFQFHGQVAQLTIQQLTYFVDWFKVISGEGGNLWSMPGKLISRSRSAFSESREFIFVADNYLDCCETLTGKTIWRRKLKEPAKHILKVDNHIVLWSDESQSLRVFDVSTGRLLKTFQSEKAFVQRAMDGQFIFHNPVRKGELSAEEETRLIAGDEIENPAKIGFRYSGFDPKSEAITWTRLFHRKDRFQYSENEICVLGVDGTFKCFRADTGELTSNVDLSRDADEQRPVKRFSMQHHPAGWILQLSVDYDSPTFTKGKTSYWYSPMDRRLSIGSVYLLSESRSELLWESPVYLEHLEFAAKQPANSPAIIFGRKILRHNRGHDGQGGTLSQFLLLDVRNGNIIGDTIVDNGGQGSDHYAIDWSRGDTPANSYLTITTATDMKRIFFVTDPEQPPVPRTHMAFNAINFFEDPAFIKPNVKLVDEQLDTFQARAKDAEKRRKEVEAGSAEDLKKKMGISTP